METTEFLKALGIRIRSLRTSRGISQEKFSEMAGISPTYISEIELGKTNASIGIFEQIAAGFGLSLSELVSVRDGEEDIALTNFVSKLRGLESHKQAIVLETAEVVLKGLKEL
jgi:transcriptional regulator with XRE-family HTH domain